MTDHDDIPAPLLAAQRTFDLAHTAVAEASARPGPVAEWPAEERAGLERLRTARRDAAVALHRARSGTEWEPWAQQQRVRDEARETG